MIDFPASPTVGQTFIAAGVTWTWDGAKWLPSGLSPTVVPGINDNRIINGDMRIDARNNGASGTATGYTVDRWGYGASQASKGTWQRGTASSGVVYNAGFPYYLTFVSSSAYASLAADNFNFNQPIEADMVSDFAWGTSNAQPVTLSFWAASSLSGTFSGSIRNAAVTRSYPFTFSLPGGSTFTKITLTIPGDTAGTWVMNGNGAALYLGFDLGSGVNNRGPAGAWATTSSPGYVGATGAVSVVGTNGALFYLTGVKLETGSVATPYNRQSLAKSLADCQRYYQTSKVELLGSVYVVNGYVGNTITLPVVLRGNPTITTNWSQSTNTTTATVGALDLGALIASAQATAVGTIIAIGTYTASAEL